MDTLETVSEEIFIVDREREFIQNARLKASFVADGLIHLVVCLEKLTDLLNRIEKDPRDQDLVTKYNSKKKDALRLLGKLKDMSLTHIIDNVRKFGTNFLSP